MYAADQAVDHQRTRPLLPGLRRHLERFVQPVPALPQPSAGHPEEPQRGGHSQALVPFPGFGEAEVQGGSQVWAVLLEPAQPLDLVRADPFRVDVLGEQQEVVAVSAPQRQFFRAAAEPHPPVLLDRLQQPVAGAGVGQVLLEQHGLLH